MIHAGCICRDTKDHDCACPYYGVAGDTYTVTIVALVGPRDRVAAAGLVGDALTMAGLGYGTIVVEVRRAS